MFHFNKTQSSGNSSVAKKMAGSIRGKQGSRNFLTKSTMVPTGQRGMGQSDQIMGMDTGPLLEGFLHNREEKHLVDIYKDIYYYDPICGSVCDLLSTLPFSEFTLGGLKDDKMKVPFLESKERLNLRTLFSELSVDYLVTGTFIGSMIFDRERNIFVDLIPQDFKQSTIEALPFYGFDPIITVDFPKEVIKLFNSNHPRIQAAISSYGKDVVDKIKTGKLELDPVSTIYLPRKTMTGTEGISFLRRVLPIYFLEKNIFRGTLMESIKRQRAIMHITAGDQDWEPTEEDLQYITELFMSADADPLGAIVATRNGIQPNEVRQGGDFWQISQVWSETVDFKFKALGVSDALLSGDATYSTMESALSSFMENQKAYRSDISRKVLMNKIFPLISLTNGFFVDDAAKKRVEDLQAESRNDMSLLMSQIQDTSTLIIPSVEWEKSLEPKGDEARLGMLGTMKEMGLPVPIRAMAAAAGFDLDKMLEGKSEDLKMAKQIGDWQTELAKLQPQDDDAYASGHRPEGWASKFQTLMAAYQDFPKDVQESLAKGNPYDSNVLNGKGKVPITDRDFGELQELTTKDVNGNRHHIFDQKAAHDQMDNKIVKAVRNLQKAGKGL